MATVEETVHVSASLAEVWDQYFDAGGWRAWVDGFESVLEEDGYPEAGGTLLWRSIPAGRGEVAELVLEHEHRRRHLIEFADPEMEGRMETRFEIAGGGTRVTQSLSYTLRARGPIARIGALLFVKSQVRASLQRSLLAFKRGAEEAAALPA
jgi:hypothetical protein